MQLTGIHHLTAVTSDVRGNYRFYTQDLGMRLVKRSVNQDDVKAYHLFYADAAGSPGTDLTFFDWAMPREERGSHSIVRTHLRVKGGAALEYWARRLTELGVRHGPVVERDGRKVLDFDDPEGQRLTLIDDGGISPDGVIWDRSPVPAEFQIRGLGPIMISVSKLWSTASVLRGILNMREDRHYELADPEAPREAPAKVHVYEMGEGGPASELHVAVQPKLRTARLGAGGVHHVAFRTPDEASHQAWARHLSESGVRHSGEIDRYYFRSLYFREPEGVLFEIATDGPGFAVDESAETLGEKVALPPFLESQRAQIEANLKPIE